MKTIYCIKDDSGKIIYIGQTINFQRRIYEHRYKKHIPKTYSFEIIEQCDDNEAYEKERYYISLYNTVENGLNIIHGNGQYGIKGTGFYSRFEKGNTIWKNRKWRKVKCLENGIIYNSAKECAESLGIENAGRINNVCNGNRKSYRKYHFEYVD